MHNHHTRVLRHDVFTPDWLRTEPGAWFTGLWTADGHLGTNGAIGISLKDGNAVLLAAEAIGYPRDRVTVCRKGGAQGQTRLRIGIRYLLPRLAALGIHPGRKTGRERAPHAVAFDRHFWRGVIDGDGWISVDGSSVGLVTASQTLRDQYVAFLHATFGFDPNVTVREPGASKRAVSLYQIGVSGERAASLASLLYSSARFAMRRKHDLAHRLLDARKSLADAKAEKEQAREQAVQLYTEEKLSIYEIERQYGIPASFVLHALRTRGIPRRTRGQKAYQTHCKDGHPLSGDNLRTERNGARRCVTCARAAARRYAAKQRALTKLPC
jgi:predicted HTH domain antitoxin